MIVTMKKLLGSLQPTPETLKTLEPPIVVSLPGTSPVIVAKDEGHGVYVLDVTIRNEDVLVERIAQRVLELIKEAVV